MIPMQVTYYMMASDLSGGATAFKHLLSCPGPGPDFMIPKHGNRKKRDLVDVFDCIFFDPQQPAVLLVQRIVPELVFPDL
jgi:hypothetical protein